MWSQWKSTELIKKLGGGNSNIFYFYPYLGKIPILANIFQRGWNHQLVIKTQGLFWNHLGMFVSHPFLEPTKQDDEFYVLVGLLEPNLHLPLALVADRSKQSHERKIPKKSEKNDKLYRQTVGKLYKSPKETIRDMVSWNFTHQKRRV